VDVVVVGAAAGRIGPIEVASTPTLSLDAESPFGPCI
jgi:hypothetical protein